MEYRINQLIRKHGNYRTESDIEGIYSALQEVMTVNDDTPNDKIVDQVVDLVKCDCCGEYEKEYFTSISSLVLDEDGNHGRICDYCRSIG